MEEQTANTNEENAVLMEQKIKELQTECNVLKRNQTSDKKWSICKACHDATLEGKNCEKGRIFRLNYETAKQKLIQLIMMQQEEMNAPKSVKQEKRILEKLSQLESVVENVSLRAKSLENEAEDVDKRIDSAFRKKASLQ